MDQIAELEQAREDYRREKFQGEVKHWMMHGSSETIERRMIQHRDDLEITTPTKNVEGRATVLKEAADQLAANVNITSEDLPEKALERYQGILKLVEQNGEDLGRAYEYSCAELEKAACPFSTVSMQIFMNELQLVGGLPDTHAKLLQAVNAAIASREHGALLFWSRNLDKVAQKVSSPSKPGESQAIRDLGNRIEDAMESFRSAENKAAARRLKTLRNQWEAQKMELVIGRTKIIANAPRGSKKALPSYATPRGRTREELLFEKKKKIEADILREAGVRR